MSAFLKPFLIGIRLCLLRTRSFPPERRPNKRLGSERNRSGCDRDQQNQNEHEQLQLINLTTGKEHAFSKRARRYMK